MTTVAVCVATWKRPVLLGMLLDRLAEPGVADPDGVTVRFVVVDNDAGRSAASVVARHRALAGPIDYVVEPRRGLATVRNTAVGAAMAAEADAVVFVDDDELPEPGWLPALVATWQRTRAVVVAGPVVREIADPRKSWLAPLFVEPRPADGAAIHYATTANVLIDAALLRQAPFDPAFDTTGGEDTMFFEGVRRAGHPMVWCDAAVVREPVVPERARLRWVMRREYRRGTTLSLVLRAFGLTPWRTLKRSIAGVVHLGAGAAITATGLWRGRAELARGLHRAAFGIGLLAGLVGHRYEEYG